MINGNVGRVAAGLVDGEGAVILQGAVELGVVAVALKGEEFRKQTDYISTVFIHTESAHAVALIPVSLHLP